MALSALERIRLDKAAVDEGFGLRRPDDGDWLAYDSLGAPASIRLTYFDQRYLIGVNHPGAAVDLVQRWTKWTDYNSLAAPADFTVFAVSDTEPLHHLIREIWRLARSLPIEPSRRCPLEAHIASLTLSCRTSSMRGCAGCAFSPNISRIPSTGT